VDGIHGPAPNSGGKVKKSEWDAKERNIGDTVYLKNRGEVVKGTLKTVKLSKSPNASWYNENKHHVKVAIEFKSGTQTDWRTFKALYDTEEEIKAEMEAVSEKKKEAIKKKTAERKAIKELAKDVPAGYIAKIQEILKDYRRSNRMCAEEHSKIVKQLGLPPIPLDVEMYNIELSVTRKDGGNIGTGWEIRSKVETLLMQEVPKGLWVEKGAVAEVDKYVVTRIR
jgi:phage-related protein